MAEETADTPAPAAPEAPAPEADTPPSTDELKERARGIAEDAGRTLLAGANTTGKKGFSALGGGLDRAAAFVEAKVGDDERFSRVERVTGGLHSAAGYLRERDPESVLGDLDRSIRKHPYRAIGVAALAGWLIGRLSSSD